MGKMRNRYHESSDSQFHRPQFNLSSSLVGIEREKATAMRHLDQVSKTEIQRKSKDYLPPQTRSASVSLRTRECKREFAKIRDALVCEINWLFPQLCKENLDAKAFKEFLKLEGRDRASVEPHIKFSLRYSHGKSRSLSWMHPGIFVVANKVAPCWSCCLNTTETSTGCQSVLRNRLTWSFLP
jgi:hypothetical protein